MSNKEQHPIVDMLWLTNGTPDPFPEYPNRLREDLPMADFSDDALGNYAFMYYDRDVNEEVAVMMNPQGEHRPKIAFMTAIKERVRWLSRRLAIAEGRYPGIDIPDEVVLRALEQERLAGRLHGVLSVALCVALGKAPPLYGDRMALLNHVRKLTKDLDLPEGMFEDAFGLHTAWEADKSTNSGVLRNLRKLIAYVEEKAGIKVDTAPVKGVEVRVLIDSETLADTSTPVAEVIIDQDSIEKRLPDDVVEQALDQSRKDDSAWLTQLGYLAKQLGIDDYPYYEVVSKRLMEVYEITEEQCRDGLSFFGFDGVPSGRTTYEKVITLKAFCKSLSEGLFPKKVQPEGEPVELLKPTNSQSATDEMLVNLYGTSDPTKVVMLKPLSEMQPKGDRETKPAYDPKEFSKHPSSVGWSTLDGTPPPAGFDVTPPAIEPGDVYLGTHITYQENGYIVHGLVDKHGLKVTYLCSKAGNLVQVMRWTEGLSRSYYEFKETVNKIAAYDLVNHPNPAVANSAAYPEWRDAITALYITLGVEGDKISRTDLTLKLCNEADLTLEVGGKLIVSALGYDQTLTMVQRLGALHDLIILLARQGKYVPVRGDSIYRPDDSGFTIVVQSKIHVAGMPVKVHRDVNLDNVHQIDKRG
jgi:hypothetical protein